MRVQRFAPAVGLAALLLAGCGPKFGTLSGKATVDGNLMKGGSITFNNTADGPSASAEINEDGTYTVHHIAAGEYVITVTTEYLKSGAGASKVSGVGGGAGAPGPPVLGSGGGAAPPKNVKMGRPEMPGNPADHGYNPAPPGASAGRYMKIASRYADAGQSDVKYTHSGGAETFDIKLLSK